jgi:hypothetical protein
VNSNEQLIAVIAAGLGIAIALWVITKLWKSLLGLAALGAIGVVALCISQPGNCPLKSLKLPGNAGAGWDNPTYPPALPPPVESLDLNVQLLEWPSREFPCDHVEAVVQVVIGNRGQGIAHNVVVSGYGIDRPVIPIGDMYPGQSMKIVVRPNLNGWRRGHGYHTVQIRMAVDPDNVIAESNERNNTTREVTLTCF